MNVYRTYGTLNYLSKMKDQHPKETMLLLVGEEEQAVLFHETMSEGFFKEGKKYEVIKSIGSISTTGMVVINHIPVSEEGRPLFEYQLKNGEQLIEKDSRFTSLRLLRPIQDDTYLIITIWQSEKEFQNHQIASKLNNLLNSEKKKRFPRPSYMKKYHIFHELP